jgi:rSAM/selenodomain-associated transferase 1
MQETGQCSAQATVGIMAKYWQSGKVKTRLGTSVGMDRSACLHKLFVRHLLCELGQSCAEMGSPGEGQGRLEQGRLHSPTQAPNDWKCQWVASPPDQLAVCRNQLSDWDLDDVETVCQGDGNLGDRMQRWFGHQLNASPDPKSQPSKRAILIGADCPLVTRRDIAMAFDHLDQSDIVLGPAIDGGYFLVGLRSPWQSRFRRLFEDIAWSRDDVFEVTCQRIKEIGLTASFLPAREDVDTESELNRLRDTLAQPSLRHDASNERLRDEIEHVMKTNYET